MAAFFVAQLVEMVPEEGEPLRTRALLGDNYAESTSSTFLRVT